MPLPLCSAAVHGTFANPTWSRSKTGNSRERDAPAARVGEQCVLTDMEWQRQTLARGGLYLGTRVSSFMSECLALEAAAAYVARLLADGN